MKASTVLAVFSIISIVPVAAVADGKSSTSAFAAKYEGGSLGLEHCKVTATLQNEEVVIQAGRQRFAVPAKQITEISYGSGVRRRFGATVLDVVPFMRLGEAESYYVGVSWVKDGDANPAKSEALFRLNTAEYRDFLAGLERLTGKKAVDTNQVPTVVRYGL